MHLTGKHKSQLVYVLMNTPEELTFEENHDYTEINSKYRIKTFDIEYDEEVMQEMKLKVEQSREYINGISKAL
jgi:hypothetical protein